MRSLLALALSPALLFCVAVSSRAAQQARANPQGELQTPDRSGAANLPSAAAAPLHDLNVVRQGIPPVLLEAITDPYDPPSPLSCPVLERQVHELNMALGADFDQPETPQSPSLTHKTDRVALALIHGAAESVLPFSGFVRTLSGAQRHDQLIIEAITAGSDRRGYLKGLGEARHCPPPAVPTHPRYPPPPAKEDGAVPRYPIH